MTKNSPICAGAGVIALAGLAAYSGSFHAPFVYDDITSIVDNPSIRHLWPPWGALMPPHGDGWTVDGRPILNLSLAINYAISGTHVWSYHALNLLIHVLAGLTLFGIVRRTLQTVWPFGDENEGARGPVGLSWPRPDPAAKPAARGSRGPEAADEASNAPPAPSPPHFHLRTAKRSGHATGLAFVIALLWTVHPLQTEAVTYVIQRAESLMGLFYLLTLYCFIRGTESQETLFAVSEAERVAESGSGGALLASSAASGPRDPSAAGLAAGSGLGQLSPARPGLGNSLRLRYGGGGWYVLSVAACLLGMGTKEVAATLPVMVLFYDRTFFAGSFREAWLRRRRYYLALAATWLPFAWLLFRSGANRSGSKGFDIGISWGAWILTQFEAVVRYLRLAAWPHPLIFSYGPFWVSLGEAAPYALAVALLAGGTLWALVRKPAVGFLGFWFFGLLAPTSLVPGISEMITERRMYLPLAGVLALVVPAVYAWLGRRSLPIFLLAAAGFAGLTWRRNLIYRTDYSLWSDTVAKRPKNGTAQYNLGVAYFNRGQIDEEVAHYRTALRLNPDNYEAHHSLANELYHQGHWDEAERHFEAALEIRPDFATIHYDYGILLFAEGRDAEAIAQDEEAFRLRTEYPEAHDNLGIVLAKDGRTAEAIAQFRAALKIDPDLLRAHVNLGGALAGADHLPEAAAEYEAALRLDPGFVGAHFYLANVLCQEERFAEAIPHYEAVLRANPRNADAHHNLGVALAEVGRSDEAKAQFEAAAESGGAH